MFLMIISMTPFIKKHYLTDLLPKINKCDQIKIKRFVLKADSATTMGDSLLQYII